MNIIQKEEFGGNLFQCKLMILQQWQLSQHFVHLELGWSKTHFSWKSLCILFLIVHILFIYMFISIFLILIMFYTFFYTCMFLVSFSCFFLFKFMFHKITLENCLLCQLSVRGILHHQKPSFKSPHIFT